MPVEKASRQRYTKPEEGFRDMPPLGVDMEGDFAHYHEALARVHHAALHGPGIAAGFAVAPTADRAGVRVAAGVAVTPAGSLVVLPDAGPALVGDADAPAPVPVALTPPAPEGVFVLTAGPARRPEEGERCGRFGVTARLRLVPGATFVPDPDAVVVAVVQMFRGAVAAVADRNAAVPAAQVRRTGEAAVLRQVEALAATVARLQQQVEELQAHLP